MGPLAALQATERSTTQGGSTLQEEELGQTGDTGRRGAKVGRQEGHGETGVGH